MMHPNNLKAIENWTAKNYADAYRDYVNNWADVAHWFSQYFPEDEIRNTVYEFHDTCLAFHRMGF